MRKWIIRLLFLHSAISSIVGVILVVRGRKKLAKVDD